MQFGDGRGRRGRRLGFGLRFGWGRWLGLGLLLLGIWLGFGQLLAVAMGLVLIGGWLAVIGGLRPALSPEMATCLLDKGAGLIQVVHQMPCDRTLSEYRLADLQAIELHRHRRGWRRDYFTVVLKIDAPGGEAVWLHLDGRCDRIFVQRFDLVGVGCRLLAKTIEYRFGRKMQVRWEYIELPQGMGWLKLGRKVMARRGTQVLRRNEMALLVAKLEDFLDWNQGGLALLDLNATHDSHAERRFATHAAVERKVG
jgi:hypothetical protein